VIFLKNFFFRPSPARGRLMDFFFGVELCVCVVKILLFSYCELIVLIHV